MRDGPHVGDGVPHRDARTNDRDLGGGLNKTALSEFVGLPYGEEIDVFCLGSSQKSVGEKVDIDRIDIDMWSRLPFGVKVILGAEKALVVRGAGHERNARWLIEGIVNAVAPKKIDTGRDREIGNRLHRNRREH